MGSGSALRAYIEASGIDLCVDQFNNSCALEQHMQSDHDTNPVTLSWSCIICDKMFKTDAESLEHLTSEHNIESSENNDSVTITEEEKETSECVKKSSLIMSLMK